MKSSMKWVLCLTTILAGFSSLAASKTILLTGTVLERQDLVVSIVAPLASASITEGVTEYPLCSIAEQSNSGSGYTVTLESANAGSGNDFKLVGTTAGNEVIYEMSYGGSPVALSGGKAVVTDSTGKSPKTGTPRNLSITIPAEQDPAADVYSDILTLTLAAK